MIKVLVTGGNGQLASCLRAAQNMFPQLQLVFKNSSQLNITKKAQVDSVFAKVKPSFCINCAGNTAVDNAELAPKKAKSINTNGARILAMACDTYQVKLIHISTDFIFDGYTKTSYKEEDKPNPLSVYGQTKLEGEQAIRTVLKAHFIIRSAWLFSAYGHNFLKTMLSLGNTKKEVKVVDDQVGSPTYAGDLAEAILHLIDENTDKYGTYHYSNSGSTSWYGFAQKIFELSKLNCEVLPISSAVYGAPAKRPAFSVLNNEKFKKVFGIKIPNWQESLKLCLDKHKANL